MYKLEPAIARWQDKVIGANGLQIPFTRGMQIAEVFFNDLGSFCLGNGFVIEESQGILVNIVNLRYWDNV